MENPSQIRSSQSDSCDHQLLLPIASLFPANDIITKQYAPDTSPNFRLILPQKREKKKGMVTFTQPKQQLYWSVFTQEDTLGYSYASLMGRGLVYLKFNNTSCMSLTPSPNYLAGIFIPLPRLLTQPLRTHKHVLALMGDVGFPGNRSYPQTSFADNTFPQASGVRFSSNYQGANLFMAVQSGQNQYQLVLQNDVNSRGNTQWFNFAVQFKKQGKYCFNIVNLTKSSSLYQKGMRIVLYSLNTRKWQRGCTNIIYQQSNFLREHFNEEHYYKLHFEYHNSYPHDIVTFAYSYPYNSIDLQRFFNQLTSKKNMGVLRVTRVQIAQSLTAMPLYAYLIAPKTTTSRKLLSSPSDNQQSIPGVVFMARQHPGQSQTSYIMQGVVEWLLQADSQGWRRGYHFAIVPMINIDGVTHGNYRTNLSGNDLNRSWKITRKDYHPQIYGLKKFLMNFNKTHPLSLILDIHGHSNALNSFFYGNPPRKDQPSPKHFPYYCSRKIKQVSYQQSTFSVSAQKKTCARVVLGQMFPKALVYTFQNSFYGWRKGRSVVEFTMESYRRVGREITQCWLQYSKLCEKNPSIRERWAKEIEEIQRIGKEMESQEVLTQSDDEAQKELIQFQQLKQETREGKMIGTVRPTSPSPMKTSIGKYTRVRYARKQSPMPSKVSSPLVNQSCLDRSQQFQSQGFLSIIKINTRPTIQPLAPDWKQFQTKKSLKMNERSLKDQIVQTQHQYLDKGSQDNTNQWLEKQQSLGMKQNWSDKFIKVGRLLNQKQIMNQRYRRNRKNMHQALVFPKTCNGFLRLTNLNRFPHK